MLDKLFYALAKRRAKKIANVLKIENNYTCTSDDIGAITVAIYVFNWPDDRIKNLILHVGGAA